MSSAITDSFSADHHRCDRLLAKAERQLAGGDWPAALEAADGLVVAMERHFSLEEGVLFPELAQVFQVAEQPIEIMLAEHTQMRALFADLRDAVASRDKPASLGILETLHFLVQQHNYKEEGVLYPMADGALPTEGVRIGAHLAEV
jgi:iron-sulfur cluster repair protein YtfE (RIC family)